MQFDPIKILLDLPSDVFLPLCLVGLVLLALEGLELLGDNLLVTNAGVFGFIEVNGAKGCHQAATTQEYHRDIQDYVGDFILYLRVSDDRHQKQSQGRENNRYFEQNGCEFEEGLVLLCRFVYEFLFDDAVGCVEIKLPLLTNLLKSCSEIIPSRYLMFCLYWLVLNP